MRRATSPLYSLLLFLISLQFSSLVSAAGNTSFPSGKNLFETRCLECHGMDAKGSLEAAKRLKVDPRQLDLTRDAIIRKSAADLKKLIAGGHGKMPKHKERLTVGQIRAVVKYLQSLQTTVASK